MDYMKPEEHSKAVRKSADSLGKIAEEAKWTRLGYVVQDTRWLPSTGANVSEPHAYAEEYDSKRFMRWIATYLSTKCDISSEVQCYHEESKCIILVAANENFDIIKLESMVDAMSLICFFQKVSEEQNPFGLGKMTETLGDRQIRHWQELKKISDMADKSEKVTWSEYSFL